MSLRTSGTRAKRFRARFSICVDRPNPFPIPATFGAHIVPLWSGVIQGEVQDRIIRKLKGKGGDLDQNDSVFNMGHIYGRLRALARPMP